MDIVATQKYLIGSPRKLREITHLIKNLSPESAVERLPFVGRRAAGDLRKVVMTAIANAKQRGLNPQDLIFKEIAINEGPRLKRFQAGSRGRAKPYKKRMSHIRIVLTTQIDNKSNPTLSGASKLLKDKSKAEKSNEDKVKQVKKEAHGTKS